MKGPSKARLEELRKENEIATAMAERLLGTPEFVAPILRDATDRTIRRVVRSGVREARGSAPCPLCGKSADRFWEYQAVCYASEAAEPSYYRTTAIEFVCPKCGPVKVESRRGWLKGRPDFSPGE